MKYLQKVGLCLLFLSLSQWTLAQVSTTANDFVPENDDYFRYGVNPGYYPSWGNLDTTIANIAAGNPAQGIEGAGIKAFRASLPEWFVNQFGYEIRVFAFEHYEEIGMDNHTAFLQGPEAAHTDNTFYCANESSHLFQNMYLDIWDDGSDGTPINESNYFATYVYNTVSVYKDYVRYWEIWNEPDLTNSLNSFTPPGTPGNWWENDPDPCDLHIKAPIYHYIRLLRIAYEVIKTVDPDAYVTTGGIGYPSFLHAIMRNTDNPVDGSVSADYPLTGGAYFDVLSYHVYPHIDACYRVGWNNDIMDFDYQRHSDAGADCLIQNKLEYEVVLDEFGYDGTTFPEKRWIITETNVPRKGILQGGDYYGNDEIQRNWVIKAFIQSQKNEIDQVHLFRLGETEDYETASYEFNLMGLYKNLNGNVPYQQEYTNEGVAMRTMSAFLFEWSYDENQTNALNLPNGVEGAAFSNTNGEFRYVLWARTETDQSEIASANFSFPSNLNIENLQKTNWSASIDGLSSSISSENIALSGEPVFLEPSLSAGCESFAVTVNGTDFCVSTDLSVVGNYDSYLWNTGETTNTISVSNSGVYAVTVTDENACTASETVFVTQTVSPTLSIQESIGICEGGTYLLEYTEDFESYLWWDGSTNSTNTVNEDGTYLLTVTDEMGCTQEISWSVNFTFYEDYELNEEVHICEGEIYNWNGQTYSAAGIYTQNFNTTQACDSIVHLALVIEEMIETSENINLCFGENYNGTPQFSSQTVEAILPSTTACDTLQTININVSTPIEIELTSNSDCSGLGSIEATIEGGNGNYTYLWNNGSAFSELSSIPSGFYTLTITDAQGCTTSNELSIVFPSTTENIENINICEGETYEFEGNSYTETGVYTETYTTTQGCDSILILNLLVNNLVETSENINLCFGENYNGTPQFSSQTVEAILPSTTACDTLQTININVSTPIEIELTSNSDCSGLGSIEAMVEGGNGNYTYLWNNGSTFSELSSIPSGFYTLTITDAQGCTASNELSIVFPSTTENIENINICEGETYEFEGNSYTETGVYTETYVSSMACDSIVGINLQVQDLLEVNESLTLCYGEEYNGAILTESTTIETLIASKNACDTIYILDIIVLSELQLETFAATDCEGTGTVGVNASGSMGNYSYLWETGDTQNTVTQLPEGNYTVTVSDAAACQTTASINLETNEIMEMVLEANHISCTGGADGSINVMVVGGMSPYLYEPSSNISLEAGNYTIVVTDANGCLVYGEASINEPASLEIEFTTSMEINGNDGSASANIFGGTPPYAYLWSNGSNEAFIENLVGGIYSLTITDANACELVETVEVETIVSTNDLVQKAWKIYPNPIQNDFFFEYNARTNQEIQIEIYTTIGQLIQTEILSGSQIREKITLREVPAALYCLKIQIGETIYYDKIVKE